MKFLERSDSVFVELMDALLQIMRLMSKQELHVMLVKDLKKFLDHFLAKANFLSYLKRKHNHPLLSYSESIKIMELLCGKNFSQEEGPFRTVPNNYVYKQLEKLRDQCSWKRYEIGKTDYEVVELDGFASIVVCQPSQGHGSLYFNKPDQLNKKECYWGNFVFILKHRREALEIVYAHESYVWRPEDRPDRFIVCRSKPGE